VGTLLRIHARRILQSENGLGSFECRIEDESGQIAAATVSVFQSAGEVEFSDQNLT
jgi:predicted hotdog family 3-hydroxylacyl-ACP dehydratase